MGGKALIIAVLALVIFTQATRVVIGYEDPSSLTDLQALNKTGDIKMLKHIKEIRAVVVNVPDHKVGVLKDKLKGVRYVEEDKIAWATGFADYADVQWNIKMVNAPLVWDTYFVTIRDAAFGYGVTVAVLDTGIDYAHPELYGKVVYCINTVGISLYKGTKLKNCADRNGHGTHVAGIIAASLDNVGVAGVAPKVRLIAMTPSPP
ncbi:S8 family serine peptidase [Pyrobaculum neutrophilum]|uniref:S8 family serine peptidase n=1 Tax=Pyrobaculum neutrophilum TaxID=70771 RepID=UPI001FE06E30|nr:S8 family serine peptidase [Pyrobaculum neutrophilum]